VRPPPPSLYIFDTCTSGACKATDRFANTAYFLPCSRTTTITAEKLDDHRDMINVATVNLEERLAIIDTKLESIFQRNVPDSDEDAAELRQIREDRLGTQKCLQICVQLSHHIDQIQTQVPTPTGRPRRDARLVDPGVVTNQTVQECKEKLTATAARLEKNMQDLIDRLVQKSKTAMSDEEQAAELATLQADWESARECISICSKADMNLNENISVIDNFATGDDAVQFLVSTNNKTIHAKNRGYGLRPRQLGGHLSDESLQQISRDMTLSVSGYAEYDRSPSREKSARTPDVTVESSGMDFRERYGPGFPLKSEPTPETGFRKA
jgi:hypothetical protein